MSTHPTILSEMIRTEAEGDRKDPADPRRDSSATAGAGADSGSGLGPDGRGPGQRPDPAGQDIDPD